MLWRWQVIAELCAEHDLQVGAEIGVASGRFSAGLLQRCPAVRLWAVDDFLPGYETWMGTNWSEHEQAVNRAKALAVVDRYRPRMTLLEKRSLDAAAWLEPASLDFVFIDADHAYDAVKADIEAWRKVLRPGGWLTGHDYDRHRFPGVVEAVDDAFARITRGDDYTWMVKL